MSNYKKNFKTDPTTFFMSEPASAPDQTTAQPQNQDQTSAAPDQFSVPMGYKIVQESKSRRLQLLVRPSVLAALRRICDAEGTSVNEKINQLIESYVKGKEGE